MISLHILFQILVIRVSEIYSSGSSSELNMQRMHTLATVTVRCAQRLWGWLETATRLVLQGEAQGSGNMWKD